MINKARKFFRVANKTGLLGAIARSTFPRQRQVSSDSALEATYRWLCDAQDSSPDGGVAMAYSLVNGWSPSYPETTGYIIPTFLACAALRNDIGSRDRALRMADWEIDVQLPDGAVQSGPLGTPIAPAVFNTGQVLFGWNAAFRLTGDVRYSNAAIRGGRWLLSQMDQDGAWRTNLSSLCEVSPIVINVRSAWSLAETGVMLGIEEFVDAGRRNCDWAITMQDETGWFRSNAFKHGEAPLLHNICYAIEGLMGAGMLLGEERWIASAVRAAEGLFRHYTSHGRTYGRYDTGWAPAASWRCLTGDAQLAGCFMRLVKAGLAPATYHQAATDMIDSVCATQSISSRWQKGVSGGVAGAWPIWGPYISFAYPNWAAKFHLDALLLLLHGIDVHDPRPDCVSRNI